MYHLGMTNDAMRATVDMVIAAAAEAGMVVGPMQDRGKWRLAEVRTLPGALAGHVEVFPSGEWVEFCDAGFPLVRRGHAVEARRYGAPRMPPPVPPSDDEVRYASHRGGLWSGEPHETVYTLRSGEVVVLPGHLLHGTRRVA
jgi:hypothetical protein